MLDAFIRLALKHRALVLAAALVLSAYGLFTAGQLPVDVFPDLNRPTVTVMTEAPGLAPEEIETQVTFHIEAALNGAPGVTRVRSTSGVGLSVVYAEFDWNTNINWDRQVVQELLAQTKEKLPRGVTPVLGPISSIMGEIMLIGVSSGKTDPMDLRTAADWVMRPRLLSVPGVSQITVMGGGRKQYQVLADPERMRQFGIRFEELQQALEEANQNSGGGFTVTQSQEFLIRNLGRIRSVEELANLVVTRGNLPVRVRDVATVRIAPQFQRGDGSVNGKPAVILAVQKQPGADTRAVTAAIDAALASLRKDLPADVQVNGLFRQAHFIEAAMRNVSTALLEGALLVSLILILFLMNARTTAITLTAIPVSLLCTALIFKLSGLSINTMTLGGIAVAMGELVDDAIVDVENVLRRLRENAAAAKPEPALRVIYRASSEVRNSIVFSTALVLLVFLPLFALPGIEGRLFSPLATAYIVSILLSLLVSLTLTPVLAYYLLGHRSIDAEKSDGPLLRGSKVAARWIYGLTLPRPKLVALLGAALLLGAGLMLSRLGTEFLPAFNEGTATITVATQPGTALEESNRLGTRAEELLLAIPEIKSTGRRTGRAEQDEHAEGVNNSEIDVDFWTPAEARSPERHQTPSGRMPPRELRDQSTVLAEINTELAALPGVVVNIGQPISHRIDHLLSGVRAQVAVKISGPELDALRKLARQTEAAMHGIRGVVQLQTEQQVLIPQVRIRVKADAAAHYGFTSGSLVQTFETALQGRVISQVIEGQRLFDLLLWTSESVRENTEKLAELRLVSPTGAIVLLSDVADVVESYGPNQINRENVARRIVVFCNVLGRDLGSTVGEIQESIGAHVRFPEGYSVTYGGQFESSQRAMRLLTVLGVLSLIGMFFLLYSHFRSAALVAQVMLNIPFAFVGAVAALWLAGEPLSVASMVGFISLTGIASRNGIMMISHYLHLMVEDGMQFGRELVIRGSQERVAPVLMTALTTILGLIPLVLFAKGAPGKEILYPVGLVVFGGIMTSTLLDFAITPTVFLNFSGKAAQAVADRACAERQALREQKVLVEQSQAHSLAKGN